MKPKKEGRTVDVSFGTWLELACKYDYLASRRLLCVLLLLVCALLLGVYGNLVVGLSLFCGLGVAFLLALRHAWRQALDNPPWYLTEVQNEADNNQRS